MEEQTMVQEERWQPTLASLFDCWQLFFTHLDPDDLSHQILEVVAQATRASRASLMLLNEDEGVLVIKAAVGLPPEVVATSRVRPGEGIAGWVAQNRRSLLLPDGLDVPISVREASGGELRSIPPTNRPDGSDIPSSVREALKREDITSALCVPLEVEKRVLGVLNLARQGGGAPFTQQDVWFASVVAERVAVALQNARLYSQLSSQLESRERFISRIVESIPTSLVVIDRALRIVSVNRNFLEKTRREEQATLSRKIEEVFPQVLLKYTRLDEKVQEIFRTGKPVEGGKFAYRAPSLPTRTYYYRLIPLSLSPRPGEVEGGVENVMLLMDDITEREKLGEEVRRAERHLASVVDSAYDLVASMDAEARILTWNRAAERTSGFRPEEVKGQYLSNLCVEEDQREMRSWLTQLTRGQFTKKSIEINLRTKGGEEVPISWVGSRMLDDERRIVSLVAVGRDLTERKRLEAQLIRSAKLTSLGVMAGGIAHEIRNPLAISSAAAQLLLE